MTSPALTQASANLLAQLANPAARALALGAIAGLGLLAFRVKTTSTRLFTWTAVLYAAIAVPILGWILPPLPVPVPALLQQTWTILPETEAQSGTNVDVATVTENSAAQATERRQNTARPERSRTIASSGNGMVSVNQPQRGERTTVSWDPASTAASSRLFETPPSPSRPPWTIVAVALYLAVAFILLARFLIGFAYGRRLIRTARTIDDPLITRRLDSRVSARIAESELISVPVTMGAFRPAILLPANWRDWDDAKLDAVLAHECSHVARRDALTQRLSLIHRAIFWFSPLAWFLDRHLANLAEQASDEAALSCGTDRKRYARILLDFFEALHAAPGRVWWQGVSMAKAGQAEQRVERILSWKGSVAMQLKKSITVIIVALAIPVVYLAASAHPQHVPMMGAQFADDQTPDATQQAAAPSKPQAATTPSPAIASAPDAASSPEPAALAEPIVTPATAAGVIRGVSAATPVVPRAPMTVPAVPPSPALAPVAPRAYQFYRSDSKTQAEARALAMQARATADQYRAPRASYGSGSSYAYGYGYDDDQRFVIVTGNSDSLTMSGSTEDAHHVQKLRKSIPGDFIWFQADEKSYIIRDQATIDRARKLWAPQEELGKKQEALGKQQDILGQQQDALGARMEKIQVKVPDMTAELDKLKAELKALGSSASMDQIGKIQEEMGALQEKMGEIQSNAGEEQGKLGEEMGALGEKQGKLGEQQGELGRQQAELAQKANREMKLLLEDAVKKGIAQPEL